MILIGRDLSPFTRRVAATLALLGFKVERRPLSTATDGDEIRKHNPLGRVPALLLDDGETLIDSAAILDYLDDHVGEGRALVPAKGLPRRQVLKLVAMAQGVMEKAVAAFYERTRRPVDKLHAPWLALLESQIAAGLKALDDGLSPDGEWLALSRMTQADVSAVCALDFVAVTSPHLLETLDLKRLAALSARLNTLPAFAQTQPKL